MMIALVVVVAAAVAGLWVRSKQRKCKRLAAKLGIRPAEVPFPTGNRNEFVDKYQRKVDSMLVRLGAKVAQARFDLGTFDRLALRDMQWNDADGDRLDQSLDLAERELEEFFRLAKDFGFGLPVDADVRRWEAYVPSDPDPTAA